MDMGQDVLLICMDRMVYIGVSVHLSDGRIRPCRNGYAQEPNDGPEEGKNTHLSATTAFWRRMMIIRRMGQ